MDQQSSSIQIWIFVPWKSPFDGTNWIEQILGEIILPMTHEYSAQTDAIWMTRYISSMSKEPYGGLQQPFLIRQQDGQEYWRHARLRFLLKGEMDSFKLRLETLRQRLKTKPQSWAMFQAVIGGVLG